MSSNVPRHTRTWMEVTLSDICLAVIAVFVVLAYFKGWG